MSAYKFYPINNPALETILKKKEVSKICYASGNVFINQDYEPSDNIVLSTESTTGKICFENKLEFKGASSKDLYNSVKQMSTGTVDYHLLSSDDKDFSHLNYRGRFTTSFAGDPYDIIFTLNIKFKDEKIKYEYRDFVMVMKRSNQKITQDFFGNASYVTTIDGNKEIKSVDFFYAGGNKYSDTKSFWSPIQLNVTNSINAITKACTDAQKDW